MEKRILNDLKEIYFDMTDNCESYEYDCRQCPYDKICDKIADLIIMINTNHQKVENKKEVK